jgi:hypothetical protein
LEERKVRSGVVFRQQRAARHIGGAQAQARAEQQLCAGAGAIRPFHQHALHRPANVGLERAPAARLQQVTLGMSLGEGIPARGIGLRHRQRGGRFRLLYRHICSLMIQSRARLPAWRHTRSP